jgi:hypothetical protein
MKRVYLPLVLAAVLANGVQAGEKDGTKPAPPGFTPLFNGKDLTGWKDADKQAASWVVEKGLLHYTGKGGKNLATAKNYKNFEMWVDWKITKGGDSGIYLRGKPQVQIWDNKEGSGGLWNNPAGSTGKEPIVVKDKKPGEWNTFYLKMIGSTVTVALNETIVVDNATFLPQQKLPADGPIELQVHGSPLWFRNVFVREIPSETKK